MSSSDPSVLRLIDAAETLRAPTVADFVRALEVVKTQGSKLVTRDGFAFTPSELSAISVALREAADRRITVELRKLSSGAQLARKLVAVARAARDAWEDTR